MRAPEIEESKAVLWKQDFPMNTGEEVGFSETHGLGVEVLWQDMAAANKDIRVRTRLYRTDSLECSKVIL